MKPARAIIALAVFFGCRVILLPYHGLLGTIDTRTKSSSMTY